MNENFICLSSFYFSYFDYIDEGNMSTYILYYKELNLNESKQNKFNSIIFNADETNSTNLLAIPES